MNCKKAKTILSRHADGERVDDRALVLARAHAEECAECFRFAGDIRNMRVRIGDAYGHYAPVPADRIMRAVRCVSEAREAASRRRERIVFNDIIPAMVATTILALVILSVNVLRVQPVSPVKGYLLQGFTSGEAIYLSHAADNSHGE